MTSYVQLDAVVLEQERSNQKGAADNATSQDQSYALNELIITLMRENVLIDLERKALLQKLLR